MLSNGKWSEDSLIKFSRNNLQKNCLKIFWKKLMQIFFFEDIQKKKFCSKIFIKYFLPKFFKRSYEEYQRRRSPKKIWIMGERYQQDLDTFSLISCTCKIIKILLVIFPQNQKCISQFYGFEEFLKYDNHWNSKFLFQPKVVTNFLHPS